MILDAIVIVIVIGTMVQGYRHGLLQTFIHTIGWIVSLGLGFIVSPKVKALVMDNTRLYEHIYTNINEKVSTILTPNQIQTDMPTIIQNPFFKFTDSLSGSISQGLSDFIMTIICFLIVSLFVELLLHVIISLFSKRHNHGITGFLDGSSGMFFGFIKGIVYVFIFLAFMFPLTSLANPDVMNGLATSLHNSHFAIELYHNNLVLLIVRDLL